MIINNLAGGEVEITDIKRFLGGTEYDISDVYFGDKHIFESWRELESPLPITILAAGEDLIDYRIYGNTENGESVGERTEQLFDISNAKPNKYINVNTGEVKNVSAGGYMLSDYIDVSDMDAVVMSSTVGAGTSGSGGHINLYDASKNWIRGHSTYQASPANTKKVFLADVSNASYVRVDYAADFLLQNSLIGGSTAPASYVPYGYDISMSVKNWSPYNTHAGKIIDMTTGDENSAAQYTTAYFNNFFPSTAVISVKADTAGGGRTLRYVPYDENQVPMLAYKAETNFVRDGRVAQLIVTIPSGAAYYGVSYHNGDTRKEISTTTPIYIGDEPLGEDEYVDYGEQKVYRMVNGILTPTDPPVPLPALPTVDGTTIIDYDGTPKPSQMYIKYNSRADGNSAR